VEISTTKKIWIHLIQHVTPFVSYEATNEQTSFQNVVLTVPTDKTQLIFSEEGKL
jgi:hypothetical protein